MLTRLWVLIKDTVEGYIEDGAMSRGAAIAYYTVFSIAPLLLIATAIAGLAFGEKAVEGAIADQLQGLLGRQGAEAVQAMVEGAANPTSGTIATVISIVTLLIVISLDFLASRCVARKLTARGACIVLVAHGVRDLARCADFLVCVLCSTRRLWTSQSVFAQGLLSGGSLAASLDTLCTRLPLHLVGLVGSGLGRRNRGSRRLRLGI